MRNGTPTEHVRCHNALRRSLPARLCHSQVMLARSWQRLPCATNVECQRAQEGRYLARILRQKPYGASQGGLPDTALQPFQHHCSGKDAAVALLPRHGSDMLQQTPNTTNTDSSTVAMQDHPIMQLVLQRAANGSRPGARRPGDAAKVGLVVEGGGMRGVVSGAMLMALHALGLRDSFDVVYGASAGAINTTYFLTGQPEGLHIYSEDLTGTRFINLQELFRGGCVMNLGYLIDHIMHQVKPLDWHGVLSSPLPLKVVASSLDTLQPVLLEGWQSRQDLVECLKATATVPQLAGHPREWRGHRLVDAAVFEPVPVQSALKDGCTHVLVLRTRPPTSTCSRINRAFQGTLTRLVKQTLINAPYMQPAWSSPLSHQLAALDEQLFATLFEHPSVTHEKMGGYVLPVYPISTAGCHPATTCPLTLKQAEAEGWRAIANLFNCPQLLIDMGLEQPALSSTQLRNHIVPAGGLSRIRVNTSSHIFSTVTVPTATSLENVAVPSPSPSASASPSLSSSPSPIPAASFAVASRTTSTKETATWGKGDANHSIQQQVPQLQPIAAHLPVLRMHSWQGPPRWRW